MYRPCIPTQIPCPGPQGPGAPVAKPQPVSSSAWRSHTRARCPTALPFGTVIRGRASLARPVCRVYPRGSRPLQQGAAAVGEAHQPRFACSPVRLRPVYQPSLAGSLARAGTGSKSTVGEVGRYWRDTSTTRRVLVRGYPPCSAVRTNHLQTGSWCMWDVAHGVNEARRRDGSVEVPASPSLSSPMAVVVNRCRVGLWGGGGDAVAGFSEPWRHVRRKSKNAKEVESGFQNLGGGNSDQSNQVAALPYVRPVVTSHAATPTPASWRGECRPSGWPWRTLHTGQHQGRQVLVLALIWPDTRSSRVKVKTSLCAFGICVAGVGSPTSPQRPCLSCLLWR